MLFEHGAVLYSRADDSFTTPRQVVLTPDGFIYLGMAGIAVSVLHDETGVCMSVCLSRRWLQNKTGWCCRIAIARGALLSVARNCAVELACAPAQSMWQGS